MQPEKMDYLQGNDNLNDFDYYIRNLVFKTTGGKEPSVPNSVSGTKPCRVAGETQGSRMKEAWENLLLADLCC